MVAPAIDNQSQQDSPETIVCMARRFLKETIADELEL